MSYRALLDETQTILGLMETYQIVDVLRSKPPTVFLADGGLLVDLPDVEIAPLKGVEGSGPFVATVVLEGIRFIGPYTGSSGETT